ncbi:beta-glucosidase [Aspergillus clavatus NRRL 1]|uniref:Probable beta-glucosidase A n=1 Tax=Aspergillus clavatus (strain ATCC 1007 / CBS 513.65 / DSM 816 / NCTC 3887 / NRRL 1 / QM 1276 / 107) TaxID=344612 RepID=BGLA_ASPCL|nr:beta-glucosidase, putative [Aspergillus clavatus NRRL 1]A1CR85.1 RecName: Full=Probable beta-glucosidase A; AltName: Full=Beta-D-glucoside glucohydrolase A; AltName: Full=Cellobiase A; AltName: Full=Gentiobiase A; Flags: Precursor [Aspergillus clavatus NRRL 1]EAW08156.1 beta-glucosidase, putative [Aspergillus clavatus NRRL 1]
MRFSWLEVAVTAASLANANVCIPLFPWYVSSPPFYPSPWANGQGEWAEAHQRAVEIVSQMTLTEKVNLTTGTGWMMEECVGQTGSVPRLGINWGLCGQDSPLGIRFSDLNSAFPAGINVAATWDKTLAYLRGKAMGEEFNDKGIDIQLGPAAGPLGKYPDGGRIWEGFSPDPALTGVLFAETIKGIQDAGVIATAKHYILNEQEQFRQVAEAQGYGYNITETLSSNVDDKTMHELYLWPFADAVRAGVGAIMCSYNQINNSYGCQNSQTLNKLLKAELGFQGFVMSDWSAHHSGVGAALAGLDMSMPGDISFDDGLSFWGANMTVGVLNGTIPAWRVDDMAVRIMTAYYKVGRDRLRVPPNFSSWTRDEYGYEHAAVSEGAWKKVNDFVNVQRDHAQLIREVGSASTVLLKNVGALPLTGKERKVGIFGEDAGSNPWGPNGCENRGCDNGTLAMAWGSGTAEFPYLVTPEQAIQSEVIKNGGNVFPVTHNGALTQMANIASQSSVSLVFVNADAGEGFISVDGNIGDRKNLTLWKNGEEVIKTVASHSNNTVVVIHSVGPILVDEWHDNPNITAILWAGLPGQESGNSIADVLYGRVNPSAKTPFTWGKTRESYGAPLVTKPNNGNGAPQDDFSEGVFIDYRYFDKRNETPVYEFGFGLSYTSFGYSHLRVQPLNGSTYVPATGTTGPAPAYGSIGSAADYLFPEGLKRITKFIYPWLNSTDLKASSADPNYGWEDSEYIPEAATDGSPQPILKAGGAPGGNPTLYHDLVKVSATITNTGNVAGYEVPQLYVSLGGPNEPRVVLRKFDRIHLAPGEQKVWTTTLTRRDLANWDVEAQDWVITKYPKRVYVGSSSRKLPLRAPLPRVQ